MASSSRNKSFRSGNKKIIYIEIQFCDQEAGKGELIILIAHSTKRASQIAGVSSSTIKKIRREAGDKRNPDFCSSKKKKLKRMSLNKQSNLKNQKNRLRKCELINYFSSM